MLPTALTSPPQVQSNSTSEVATSICLIDSSSNPPSTYSSRKLSDAWASSCAGTYAPRSFRSCRVNLETPKGLLTSDGGAALAVTPVWNELKRTAAPNGRRYGSVQ